MNRFFTFRPATWLTAVLLLTTLNTVAQQSKTRPAGAAGGHTAPPPPTSVPTPALVPTPAPAPAPVPVVAAPAAPPEQDIIFDLKGNELAGQVLEVTPTQVVYRPAGSDVALPPTILDKSTLFMVRYANGSRETFAAPVAPAAVAGGMASVSSNPYSEAQLTQQGRADALRYHSYKGAFWGTYGATMIGGLIGAAVVGGVISSAQPDIDRDPIPNRALLLQPRYRESYTVQVRQRKGGKALQGFGAAVATVVGLVLIIVSSASQ